ncbi:protein NBR1 homolog [Cynara cardunculus var. scolymus]|uniref:protein NBR1 homolog n=1 Tax=Cynara cardunculus var. scolymus TaxID=59895 RepID=UPI000D629F07|nr:protein NBR1 homolog [Cynara cardunculus var. scolymus]
MAPVSTVIKVKFGDTLRRFNVLIQKEEFNFDIVMLRNKICSLFGFSPDVDFTLTYIDEDGDVVTLCDDDDLQDVAAQSLDPLRITVSLDTDNLDRSSLTSSESSTPLSSPQDQLPSQFLNSRVLEILKYVPESLHDGLSKLLLFLASETANSTVVLAELVEKMQMTHLNKPSECKAGSMVTSDIKEQQGLKIAEPSKRSPATYLEALTMNEHKVWEDDEDGSADSKNKTVQIETVAKDVKHEDLHPPRSLDLNVPYSGPENFQYLVNSEDVKGSGSRNCGGAASFSDDCTTQLAFEADSVLKSKKDTENISTGVQQNSVGFGASNPDYLKRCLQDSNMKETSGFPWTKTIKATNDSSSSSGWQQGTLSAINECPFKGMMPLSSDSTLHACPYASRVPPFKRSYNHSNGLDNLFHMGVQCDKCGVHPISGPHYKSKVKDDNHLCFNCFEEMGHDADYIKMDHPMIAHYPSPFKGFQDHSVGASAPEVKPSLSKLDSCFVLDVNVYDGTIMAPSTTFTKIWRMRNNGDVIWPQGSQLLWTGGDWLSNTVSVEVEIPADGLRVDQELDIAVDFAAPELPGQYVSYWRMASPSGQKFGQRVWVFIQVDDGLKDSGEISINLNLPPVKDPQVVKSGMGHDSELHENHFVGVVEPEDLFLDAEPYRDQVTTSSK